VRLSASPIHDASGTIMAYVLLADDLTDTHRAQAALRNAHAGLERRVEERTAELRHEVELRRQAEEALRSMSVTDPLTGLYNRRGFLAMTDQHLKLAQRERRRLRLYFADMDGLKAINDQHGHLEGDSAITQAAALLKSVFRASDVVARIGGDEFAVLALEDDDNETRLHLAHLQEKLDEWNRTAARPYTLGLCVGNAVQEPDQPKTLSQLMGTADKDLYRLKKTKAAAANEPSSRLA
jgi:diguanylate cyclase (GGDEF)-like protein